MPSAHAGTTARSRARGSRCGGRSSSSSRCASAWCVKARLSARRSAQRRLRSRVGLSRARVAAAHLIGADALRAAHLGDARAARARRLGDRPHLPGWVHWVPQSPPSAQPKPICTLYSWGSQSTALRSTHCRRGPCQCQCGAGDVARRELRAAPPGCVAFHHALLWVHCCRVARCCHHM